MNKKKKKCGKRTLKNQIKRNLKKSKSLAKPASECNTTTINDNYQSAPSLSVTRQPGCNRQFQGRRIVCVTIFQTLIDATCKHASKCCGRLYLSKETWFGLQSFLHFGCDFCKFKTCVSTDSNETSLPINQAAVWGTLVGGGGYQSLFDTLKVMDVPPMMFAAYKQNELKIHQYQQNSLKNTLLENGKKELEQALKDPTTIFHDSIPCIAVTCDGGWGKRSYGHSFKSLSGSAVIIGNRTGNILWLGIRNKYCFKCDLQIQKNEQSGIQSTACPAHSGQCWKNYSGSPNSMETDIIKEGFMISKDMHGVFYNQLLGDQDSSCYPTIKDAMQQRFGLYVKKIHCVNHAIRCLNCSLYKMLKATKTYSLKSRKWLEKSITRMSVGCKAAISYNSAHRTAGCTFKTLMGDLRNVPSHVAGEHQNCRDYFCKRKGEEKDSVLTDVPFWKDLQQHFERISNLSDSLISNLKSNKAETFMSVVCKFIGGKRKNFYLNNQYTTRVIMAGNSHKQGSNSDRNSYKINFTKSPLQIWRRASFPRKKPKLFKRRIKKLTTKEDKDYGSNPKTADLPEDIYNIREKEFIQSKQIDLNKRDQIIQKTVGQSDNDYWNSTRKSLLTASNFYKIVTKQPKSNCSNLIKILLQYDIKQHSNNNNVLTDARSYGKHYEAEARKLYESIKGVDVVETGIFVDVPNGFLGASPDGLLGNDGLIEIKCPFAARDYADIKHAIMDNKIKYLDLTNGEPHLIKNSSYYFQIIGQLGITDRKYCDFFVYLPNAAKEHNYFLQRIEKDEKLWSLLKPELVRFYLTVLLPEMVDSRYKRGLPLRECSFGVSKQLVVYRMTLGKTCAQNPQIKRAVKRKSASITNDTPTREKRNIKRVKIVPKALF